MPIVSDALSLPHDGENKQLNKIIHGSLRRKGRLGVSGSGEETPFWSASFFLFHQSTLFNQLSSLEQRQILNACSAFLLSESYFIEKAGLSYCAKMILLAQTTEIKQIYGLIASDESVHLEWLTPYVQESYRTHPQGKFIGTISYMIDDCEVNTLYFLIQTILEGWGISYYKTLAKNCQIPSLQQTLLQIVKDEALHHQTGIALFDPHQLSTCALQSIYQGMKAYSDILRNSIQDIIQCFERVLGPLSLKEVTRLFEELETEKVSTIKINLLKRLMQQPVTIPLLNQLEQEGYFSPYSAKDCAAILNKSRAQSCFA